jgi:hypothetical protein
MKRLDNIDRVDQICPRYGFLAFHQKLPSLARVDSFVAEEVRSLELDTAKFQETKAV